MGEEWAEWYRLTPQEPFAESARIWDTYLAMADHLNRSLKLTGFSSMRKSGVKMLLMGGQVCAFFYGAAEPKKHYDDF